MTSSTSPTGPADPTDADPTDADPTDADPTDADPTRADPAQPDATGPAGPAEPGAAPGRRPVRVPVHRTVPRLARDPLRAFEQIGRDCDGELARLHLGLTRPYLATHPEHVQQILRRPDTYLRDGMLWRPLRRLDGDGIAGEGPPWRASRRILQPMFTVRAINALVPTMAATVEEALALLADRAAAGRPLDLVTEMTRVAHRVLIRVFFGDRLSPADAERLGEAIATAFQSLGARMLLPFLPESVPLPGDRAFRRAVRTVDRLIYPVIRTCREHGSTGDDLVAVLARTADADGEPRDDAPAGGDGGAARDERAIRDDVVSMFVAGTETTALALTWLWLLLDRHPQVAGRLRAEADRAVGDPVDGPSPEQLPELPVTRATLQETLRLYPVGWITPRTVGETDRVDGVALRRGGTVLLSPYLTHRLPEFWDDPYAFRPDRFLDDQRSRHRFAYFPFGAGAHQCLGSHFFLVEAQLVVAGMMRRFRPELAQGASLQPRATASLRPRGTPTMLLHPRRH